jgi:hypothetical protein
MAEELELGVKVKVDNKDAEESVKSWKGQLKDARMELGKMIDKFGEMSPQAAKAAKSVAQLEDKIGDAKKLTDAFNPDAKFKGLTGAIVGAVGAFEAVKGAQAAFGLESKETEKALLKVQGAMAFAQGINSVLESGAAVRALGSQLMSLSIVQKVVTAAQWAWNIAMEANPIGALVAAIAAVVLGIAGLVSWFNKSSAAAKENENAVKATGEAIKKEQKAYEENSDALQRNQSFQLALAKAKGASLKEIQKLESKLIDEKVAYLQGEKAIASNTWHTAMNTLAKLKAAGASDEQIKAQEKWVKESFEQNNKVTTDLNNALKARTDLNNKHIVENAQADTAAANKAKEKRDADAKQHAQDVKDAQKIIEDAKISVMSEKEQELAKVQSDFDEKKKKLQAAGITDFSAIEEQRNKEREAIYTKYWDKEVEDKKAHDEALNKIDQQTSDLNRQNTINAIKDKNKQALEQEKFDYEKKLRELAQIDEDPNLSQEERAAKRREREEALEKEHIDKMNQITVDGRLKAYDDLINDQEKSFEEKKTALDQEEAYLNDVNTRKTLGEEEYNKRMKALAEARKKIFSAEVLHRRAMAKEIGEDLGKLSDIVGKQTAAGKALAIGQATINTYLGATEAWKQPSTLPSPFDYVSKAINVAAIIAGGFKAVKEIVKTPIPGASGGSEPTAISMSSAPSISTAPTATVLPQAQIDQLTTANAATRAYVVESDVTSNQERIVRLNRAARIN